MTTKEYAKRLGKGYGQYLKDNPLWTPFVEIAYNNSIAIGKSVFVIIYSIIRLISLPLLPFLYIPMTYISYKQELKQYEKEITMTNTNKN